MMGDCKGIQWLPNSTQQVIPSAPPLSSDNDYMNIPADFHEVPLHQIDHHKESNKPNSDRIFWEGTPVQYREVPNLQKLNSTSLENHYGLTPPPDAVDDEPEPSAPPLELMDKVQGYESASFDIVEIPPPLIPVSLKTEGPQRSPLPSIPQLTEKEVRQALLKEVSAHCCYGRGVARDMAITSIKHSTAFHYTLETFTEKRMTSWTFEPYSGGTVDEPSSGVAPFPWEISVTPSLNFHNNVSQIEVPHTASVKTCHICGGVGRKRCTTCSSNGWEYCFSCHGDGQKTATLQGDNERCFHCHGTGRRRCWKCNGDGMAACRSCSGTGQIRCFIRLTVVWTNHIDDHIVEKASSIRDEKIKSVMGEVVFEEEQPTLWPLNHFPDTTINMASVQLIQKHASSFMAEKVLMQRHRVRVIPVAAVNYKWKNHEGAYHVYGFEQKVHAPDYPQTCCCCCTVV